MGILQDIRYGARLLRRSPWFTLVAVASLAVGLGSAVALFTFMNALLFRPLPGHGTSDLYAITTSGYQGSRYSSSSFADFRSYVTTSPPLFANTCAVARVDGNLAIDGLAQAHPGAVMSGGCFDTLRLRPHLGRLLNASDDSADGESPIVISHSVWQRRFAGEADAVGQRVAVNGIPAVVVGVAPQGFAGLSLDSSAEFWVAPRLAPALTDPAVLTSRGDRRVRIYVRLSAGVTQSQAAARLAGVAAALRDEDPRAWTAADGSTRVVSILPELEARFAQGGASERAAIALATFGAIAAIVALACVNLATMVMARGAGRTRELNVRLALGASRRRLLRQLATESLLISGAATVMGVLVVAAALKLLNTYRPFEMPAFNLAVDWRIGIFAALLAIVTPVLFGLAPGAHALRLAIAEGIKGRVVSARRRWLPAGPREVLMVVQVAVSFALLVMTTLFLNAARPTETPTSQAARQISVVPIDFGSAEHSEADARALTTRLLQAMETVPGVVTPTAVGMIPLTGTNIGFQARLVDRPDAEDLVLDANVAAPGYFELNGIGRLAGRTFDAGDRYGAPPVAIVSESLARRLWGAAAPIGRQLRTGKEVREIVGVVADVPYRSMHGPQPVLYVPIAQSPRTFRFLLQARLTGGETSRELEQALRRVDPRIQIGTPTPLTLYTQQLLAPERIGQAMVGLAGVLQLGLALMAIWGLVAYAVERRTGEIAIRRALGATEQRIVGLMMQPSLWLLAVGTVIGCGAGVAAAGVLHAEFTGLAPIRFALAIPAALLLVVVVAIAAWLPARRAAAIEPASALKQS